MTCPTNITLNDALASTVRFKRFLSPLLLVTSLGFVTLGCSDDGGSGYVPDKGGRDDSDKDDKPDASGNDSDDNNATDDVDGGKNDHSDDPVSPGPDDLPQVDEDADDSWTILVYMNGDNDLEHFALQDVVEMANVPNNDNVTVLLQLDRAVDGASPGYSSVELGPAGEFISTKRFRVGFDELEELDDLGEANMGDPNTLAEFVTWGIEQSQTGHYALVFWDHGGGWDLFGPDDSHDHDGLELTEIAEGLREGLAGAGRKNKFDLIGFDACLMATFETAETVRPYASLLLASQELEPGSGWDWTALSILTEDPKQSAQDWGSEVIEKYSRHVGATRNATLSLVNLDKLHDLKDAINELASDLNKLQPVVVGQVRAQSPEFAAGHGKDLVDLGQLALDFADADDALEDAAGAVLDALDAVVVSNYRGPDARYAHGLSLYFPLTPRTFNAGYASLSGIAAWQKYLTSYLGAGEEIAALGGFTNPDKIGTFTYEGGILYLTGDLANGTAEQLVSADTYFGMTMDGIIVFLGQTEGAWNDSQAQGAWDLTALLGTQGEQSAPFYYAQHYSSDSDTYSFTTPVLYNGSYLLIYEMVLNSNFDMVAESYYGDIEGAIGEVNVPNEGTIQPVLLAMDENGEVTQVPLDTEFDLALEDIAFSFEILPEGTDIVMALEVTDLGGNTDLVYNAETL